MQTLLRLQQAVGVSDVARILGFTPTALSYILYIQKDSSKYKLFTIPKKSGGQREIAASKDALKLLQQKLAKLLQTCIEEANTSNEENEDSKLSYSIAHGFAKGRSTLTNAIPHRNKKYVFNVDLVDFFSSIHFGRIVGFFIKDRTFHLNPVAARIIAQIACYEKRLPQGSPCSPIISNLIAHILDVHLVKLASKHGCTYTRYADDLTFSTNKLNFPSKIATCSSLDDYEWCAGADLLRIVSYSGFQINHKKTRMQYRYSRQEVTGLVVNDKISVPVDYRRRVRSMAHSLLPKVSFIFHLLRKTKMAY